MEVRRRNVPANRAEPIRTQPVIQEFDVFSKLPQECKKTTLSGGLVTILTVVAICVLSFYELKAYLYPPVSYAYEVDSDISDSLQVNIDITVAIPCDYTSLDFLDATGASLSTRGSVQNIPTLFALDPLASRRFQHRRAMANLIRSQHHVIHQALWDAHVPIQFSHLLKPLNDGTVKSPATEPDACRMVGTLHLRKVAGNIHILYGKPLDGIDGLHIHIAPLFGEAVLNFSHRIDHFSFGVPKYNQIHPLEALEVVTNHTTQAFSYFLSMVPIRVTNQYDQLDTYQYAMTMKDRTMNHSAGSHGIPGIFFHYDTFPLRIKVEQTRELLGTFLARLAALVGGLFSTVGFLRQLTTEFPDLVLESRLGRRWRTAWTRRKIEFKRKLAETLPNGLDKVDTTAPVLDPDSET